MSSKAKELDFRQRVVVLGGAGVGKTSILSRYLYNKFTDDYAPTVEEFYTKKLLLNDRVVLLDIVDTSGVREFPAMRALSLAKADAFVLVYRLDEERSFEELRATREEIEKARGEDADIPTIVVGNMSDLGRRCIDQTTMECLVNMDWNHAYVETSAKDDVNIDKIVDELILRCQIPGVSTPSSKRRLTPAGNASPKRKSTKKKKACIIL
jgi:small GTP-binding protein